MIGSRTFALTIAALCAIAASAHAQPAATKCPRVEPKTPQEAVMMEASSHKNGCWVRGARGELMFIDDATPDANYKPLIPPIAGNGCTPALRTRPASPVSAARDLAGTWQFRSGVWPGAAELGLIDLGTRLGSGTQRESINGCMAVDLSTTRETLVRRGTQYCSAQQGGLCLSPTGLASYTARHGTVTCTFELEADVLRGACRDALVPERIELTVGKRVG